MSRGVTDRDLGWKRVMAATQELKGAAVKVGIQSDEGDTEDGVPMIVVAASNEFGTDTIPERSFMRSTYDEQRRNLEALKAKLWDGVLTGKVTPKRALELLGQRHESDIRRKIQELRDPANAPSTIEAKQSSNPLIDTQAMQRAVRYEVVGL